MPSWSTHSTDYYADWYSSPAVEEAFEEIRRRRLAFEERVRQEVSARNNAHVTYTDVQDFVSYLETRVVKKDPTKRKKSGFAKFVSRIEGK